MKAKKTAVKSAKKSEKKSVKKSAIESAKKQNSTGVKKYCEACLIIRNGSNNSPAKSQGNLVPHTCGKSEQQLREFSYNMRILNSIRKRLKSGGGYDDY